MAIDIDALVQEVQEESGDTSTQVTVASGESAQAKGKSGVKAL